MKLFIEGMSCNHCKMRVENALSEIDAVRTAKVDLANGVAIIEVSKDLPEELLKEVISDIGYTLSKIER